MSDAEISAPQSAAKPKALSNPIRRRVKKYGKRLTRWIARHQARASLVPDAPFLEPELFPFLNELRDNWEVIAEETRGVLKHREAIPGFQDISPDQYRIATEKNWRTFVLFGFGEKLEKNCAQMPRTAEMLARVPNIQIAWLSILAPGYHIPAHTGVTKGIIRTHLGLIIPKDAEKCRIRVGDQVKHWMPGELVVLDDTYEHEVWNDTDEERVVLLLDFDRPMRWSGRILNKIFLRLVKFSAFYRDPQRNARDYQDRFEAATRRADEAIERMSDP
ncbi:MAG: aspartyl/asparaginyl beta-hydroxylase domain-containing protein [Pseudomonadota bacterium]